MSLCAISAGTDREGGSARREGSQRGLSAVLFVGGEVLISRKKKTGSEPPPRTLFPPQSLFYFLRGRAGRRGRTPQTYQVAEPALISSTRGFTEASSRRDLLPAVDLFDYFPAFAQITLMHFLCHPPPISPLLRVAFTPLFLFACVRKFLLPTGITSSASPPFPLPARISCTCASKCCV